jgi:hypothetical protein
MTRLQRFAVGTVGILVAVGSVSAHHRWPVDQSTEVTVTGTVEMYRWGNPHVMLSLDVPMDDGVVERWDVGGPSTNRMEANGWDRTTLQGGEIITAIGYRFADGSRVIRLEKIVMADGSEMFLYGRP